MMTVQATCSPNRSQALPVPKFNADFAEGPAPLKVFQYREGGPLYAAFPSLPQKFI